MLHDGVEGAVLVVVPVVGRHDVGVAEVRETARDSRTATSDDVDLPHALRIVVRDQFGVEVQRMQSLRDVIAHRLVADAAHAVEPDQFSREVQGVHVVGSFVGVIASVTDRSRCVLASVGKSRS